MTMTAEVDGPKILHRLALGVECVDAVSGTTAAQSLRVGRQVVPRLLSRPVDPGWPCLDLEATKLGLFKLRYDATLPTNDIVIRVDDPERRYVPRRFVVHPWTLEELDRVDAQHVPVRSRLLRPWLQPGAAYPIPRGSTVIRGRVVRGSQPARWARLTARTPTNAVAGRAQSDDRGEFLLVVTEADQNPLQSSLDVDVEIFAPKQPVDPDPLDRLADLVAEDVAQSHVPTIPSDLDNALLRGQLVPTGYVGSTHPPEHLTVAVGAELVLSSDIAFDPLP